MQKIQQTITHMSWAEQTYVSDLLQISETVVKTVIKYTVHTKAQIYNLVCVTVKHYLRKMASKA